MKDKKQDLEKLRKAKKDHEDLIRRLRRELKLMVKRNDELRAGYKKLHQAIVRAGFGTFEEGTKTKEVYVLSCQCFVMSTEVAYHDVCTAIAYTNKKERGPGCRITKTSK